jgi:hypothetical protein
VKPGYQFLSDKPQLFGCDRFNYHALEFSLEYRAHITPTRIEDFYHGSGMTDKIDNKGFAYFLRFKKVGISLPKSKK